MFKCEDVRVHMLVCDANSCFVRICSGLHFAWAVLGRTSKTPPTSDNVYVFFLAIMQRCKVFPCNSAEVQGLSLELCRDARSFLAILQRCKDFSCNCAEVQGLSLRFCRGAVSFQ